METKTGKGIEYCPFKTEDKHYFGGFFNLAQNNIELIADEFRTRLHLKETLNKTDVFLNYFNKNNLSYTDWDRGINILQEYLPIIDYLNLPINHFKFDGIDNRIKEQEKRKFFTNNLQLLLKTINSLRNFYSHYYHKPIILEDNLFKFLDFALFEVAIEVKKRKMKTDKTKQTLKAQLDKEMKILIKLEKEHLRNKKIKTWNIDENVLGAIYNNAFSHIITKVNDKQVLYERYKSKYISTDQSIDTMVNINTSGIVFLLSMFLSKKEVENLKANLKGYKGKIFGEVDIDKITRKDNSLRNMATQWVFSFLAFKGLKHRVKNTFEKETLLMQMLDELSKVPNEIYYNINKTEQDKFIEDINEYVQDNEENEKGLEESTIIHPVIRKRYEDKFNYFAIRYLDEFANFPSLKFKVYVGNYLHDRRSKGIPGVKIETERFVKEKLNIFEKLSFVNYKKNEFFKTIDQENTKWEFFPNPSYLFNGNNIEFYIDLIKYPNAKEMFAEIQQLKNKAIIKKTRDNKPSKEDILLEIFQNKINIGSGTGLLSINELPALLYDLLVNKIDSSEIEKKLVDKLVEHYYQLKNYTINDNLSNNYIPKKMKRSSEERKLNIEKMINDIETEINITKNKLNVVANNKIDEKRKKARIVFYSYEMGNEAIWIVNDIIRFMPKNSKTSWKSTYHNELQRYISYYDRCNEDAFNLLKEFWNFNQDYFFGSDLINVFKNRNFTSFYEAYLNTRIESLEGLQKSIYNSKDEPKILKKALKDFYRCFDERLYYIQPLEHQKLQILLKPINLPRGIFNDKPSFITDKSIEDNPEFFAEHHKYSSDLIHKYQKFYDLKLSFKDNYEKYKDNYKDMDEFIKKETFKIKKSKIKDLYLKLMADDIFLKTYKKEMPYALNELYQDREERLKNQQIANQQKDRKEGDDFENIYNMNFIWNKPTSVSLFDGRIVEPQVKIKDVGKFKKLESDEKIKTLLSYNNKVWNKLEIEEEFENKPNSYERLRRESVFSVIQNFESYLLTKNSLNNKHPEDFEDKGNPHFKYYISKGVLKKINNLSDLEIEYLEKTIDYTNEFKNDFEKILKLNPIILKAFVLILLRNKFAHNQLPSKEALEIILTIQNKNDNQSYAEYFLKIINDIIEEFKNYLT